MKEGDIIDDFTLVDQAGASTTLSGLLDDGPLVLFFYLKAMTPG